MGPPPETDRLRFRDWQPTDLDAFHAICSDPQVIQFVGDGEPWSRERTAQFISGASEMSQSLGFCQWVLIHKQQQSLIGFCGFVPASDGAEIGWRLARDCWGQGLATEAARCALKHGFESLNFQSISATVQSLNRASIRIMEKLGMQPESQQLRNGREVLQYSIKRRNP